MKSEGAALPEGTEALIVAAPRNAKLQAVILIGDAQAVADPGEAVGDRKRVLVLAGQIDHSRPEDRPVTLELDPAGQPQLFLVAQILDRRVDVAVEPQIANLGIGLFGADCEVDLVAADGEIVLVD